MTEPAVWGAKIRSYGMPTEPELLWYIEPENARMTLCEQLELLLGTPKVLATVAWMPKGGVLLIVWATAELNGLEAALLDIADNSGIPITTLAN